MKDAAVIDRYEFSRDGTFAVCALRTGDLQIRDVPSGRIRRSIHVDTTIGGLSLSSDQRLCLTGANPRAQVWNLATNTCVRTLEGHTNTIWATAWSADQRRALTASADQTIRLWDLDTGECLRVLSGHTAYVMDVRWSTDSRYALSGSFDRTLRLWDLKSGECLRVIDGHTNFVHTLVWSPDQRFAISAGSDSTIRRWNLETGECLQVYEGHTGTVYQLAWSRDERFLLSGSWGDHTVRLWNVETGRCLGVFTGHSDSVSGVAFHENQRQAFTADSAGNILVWDLSEYIDAPAPSTTPEVQYTNAKVLVVGESGSGKTGLTERLARGTFTPSYSTAGTWSTQWPMQDLPAEEGWEREVWLWDFGGQADQRLVHQLYLDKTAAVLLVFNSDRDAVLPGLREWQQALSRSVPENTNTYLIAGRIDVGMRFDRERVRSFANEHGYTFFETSAQDGRGCDELRRAIQTGIPWTKLERRTSPLIFKRLKDEMLKLRDEGQVLFTFKELRDALRQRLGKESPFNDAELHTVVSLLDGPGMVKELTFGEYILLRPEWINVYAQAVIRTVRAESTNLGCLTVQSIADGALIFQVQQGSGTVEEKRLEKREETVVLQAMEQMLLERKLCLRQEGKLVFPSYCGLEKPVGPVPPKYFISYSFGGFLDDVYATLVVKLVYCGAFRLKELWRDAADFETLADGRLMGIKVLRNEDGRGTLLVHFGKGVPPQEQVIFANYIHEHLIEKATDPQRLRFYVCPHCDASVKDSEVAMLRLERDGEQADIACVNCDKRVPLWDSLERRFASEAVKKKVALLQQQERIELDSRRKGKLLALEVMARITSADQKCFEIPGVEDEGIDIDVEFTEHDRSGSGKHIYLQLKAGNSHLERRKRDGAEIFKIKKQSWVKYWLKQHCPVLLVIGTFPDENAVLRGGGSKDRFAEVRWMEISDLLRRESKNGSKPVKQFVFEGETLDIASVRRWRERTLVG